MTRWPFARAQYIDHDKALHRLTTRLAQETLIAIDTESNSLYAYRERVCLIQISTRSQDYIVDPLRIGDLWSLGSILADPHIEKVFHAVGYDLMCLKRDFGFEINNLFDTMVAARICGRKNIGLDKLLEAYCGVQADKRHQRDDWAQRPLSEDSLLYAQMDTHYLPALRDHLRAELETLGRLAEAQETFDDARHIPAASHEFDPDGYWRIAIPKDLTRRQAAILRELYLLRDELARGRDCPPFKVFTDPVLVALADAAPTTHEQLKHVKGLSANQAQRYGDRLLQAIERGRRGPLPTMPPRPPDVAPAIVELYTALRDWRRARAEERGVESDVIISKDALWELAHRTPHDLDEMDGIPGLGPWRLATYGTELLTVIHKFKRNGSGGK